MLKVVVTIFTALTLGLSGCFAQEATATPPSARQMKTMYDALQAKGLTSQGLLDVLAQSPNAYVFALQSLLAEKSLYSGGTSGILTRSTIRALNRFCAEQDIEPACQAGPLSPAGSAALSKALATPAVAAAEPVEAPKPRPPVATEPTATAEPAAKPAPQEEPVDARPSSETTPTATSTGEIVLPLQDGTSLDGWATGLGNSTLVDGRFRVTSDSPKFAGRQYITFATEPGKHYTVHAEGYAGTVAASVAVGTGSNINDAIVVSPALNGPFTESFVATGKLTFILLAATGSDGGYADFDNISVSAE
jgi:hypothetical protein